MTNLNTIIDKNNARYHETFNTVIMPRDNVYKITSITCKIDTTFLWNIRSMNVVKVVNNQGYEMITNVGTGYYAIDKLYTMPSLVRLRSMTTARHTWLARMLNRST